MSKKDIIQQELQKIAKEQGNLMPSKIVEMASDENHPLHDQFEWDDDKAAYSYRLFQARQMIVKVKIVYKDNPVQAFHNIKVVEDDGTRSQAYYQIEVILGQEDKKLQLLKNAAKEIKYWQSKYENISELSKVVNIVELEKVEKNIK